MSGNTTGEGPISDIGKIGSLIYDASCPKGASGKRGDRCQGIEDVITEARDEIGRRNARTKQQWEEEGVGGVVRQLRADAKEGVDYADKRSSAAASNMAKTIRERQTWFGVTFGLLAAAIVVLLYYLNPYGVSTHMPALCTFTVLLLAFLLVAGYTWIGDTLECPAEGAGSAGESCHVAFPSGESSVYSFLWRTLAVVGLTVLLFMIVIFIASVVASFSIGIAAFKYTLMGGIGLGLLTLIVAMSARLRKALKDPKPTFTKLIGLLIFYIPCLLYDIVVHIRHEYDNTTDEVTMILGVEAFLILLWVVVPLVLDWIVRLDGSLILREPIYLDKPASHGTMEILYNAIKRDGHYDFEKADRYIYSISAWFRINPQPPNGKLAFSEDANIISFGGRPMVTYNGETQMFRVACKLNDAHTVTIYKSDSIPLQAWTNIVVNYDGATMSVFINGRLVGSRTNIAPLTRFDLVETGQTNGLEGGIATIQFRRRTLSPTEINVAYKMLGSLPTPQL